MKDKKGQEVYFGKWKTRWDQFLDKPCKSVWTAIHEYNEGARNVSHNPHHHDYLSTRDRARIACLHFTFQMRHDSVTNVLRHSGEACGRRLNLFG